MFTFLWNKSPVMQLLGCMVDASWVFKEAVKLCSRGARPSYQPCMSDPISPVSSYPCQHVVLSTNFYFSLSYRCIMIFHCGINLHFSSGYWYWISFLVLICHLYSLFSEMSVNVFCPFSNWTVCFFTVEFWKIEQHR